MITGGLMMLITRQLTPEREGASSYYDMLFLWVIWGVAFTGMLCVLFRLLELPIAGFSIYYIHLVLVYFLLWYMPYSKFAHIIYRVLGLTFLKMHGRDIRPEIFSNGYKKIYVTKEVTA